MSLYVDVDEMPPDYACPKCGGYAIALGTLGYMLHLRCRFCGWDWSVESPDLEEEPDRD